MCDTIGRKGKDRGEFWKHSFGAATAASLIAKRTGVSDSELSFMSGLVHDVGKIVIETYFPEEDVGQHNPRWRLDGGTMGAASCTPSQSPIITRLLPNTKLPIVACVQAADACAKLAFTQNSPELPREVFQTLRLTDRQFMDIARELESRRNQIDDMLL